METIFHEKQEGSLCAQHCLNALLQGSYFTPVDLATLAQQMDEEERSRMAECGIDSEEYRQFLQQPSGNMDDSGYFSVQVISSALEVWGLDLVPYNSTEVRAIEAQSNPAGMQAFICNYRDHWFTIRKLGNQWFNLNSLLNGPELISTTYLAMFLAQLQQEGYSIFVVFGELPESDADCELYLRPAVQSVRPRSINVTKVIDQEEDPELQRALRLSLGHNTTPEVIDVEEELELEKALRLSLGQETNKGVIDSDEEEQLRQAVMLSMQTSDSPVQSTSVSDVDPVELRQRRLAYLKNPRVNT